MSAESAITLESLKKLAVAKAQKDGARLAIDRAILSRRVTAAELGQLHREAEQAEKDFEAALFGVLLSASVWENAEQLVARRTRLELVQAPGQEGG